jgi:hypothetical protein
MQTPQQKIAASFDVDRRPSFVREEEPSGRIAAGLFAQIPTISAAKQTQNETLSLAANVSASSPAAERISPSRYIELGANEIAALSRQPTCSGAGFVARRLASDAPAPSDCFSIVDCRPGVKRLFHAHKSIKRCHIR